MAEVPAQRALSSVWQCPTAAIQQDAAGSIFIMEWLGYNTSTQFRQASEKLLAIIQQSDAVAKAVLNDTEKLKIIGLSDQSWARDDFLPRLIALGIKRIAMINSVHYFTRVGVQEIMKDRPLADPQTEYFATRDEAMNWALAGVAK